MKSDLLKLEKIVKKIIRHNFRNSTLDYTVQALVSSVAPGEVKYSCLITSPSRHVQEFSFTFGSVEELEAALKAAQKDFTFEEIIKTEITSRVNTYKNKIKQLEEYQKEIDDNGIEPDTGFLIQPDKEQE